MIETAKIQKLIMSRSVDFGVYLKDKEGEGEVLLPKKQVPEGLKVGDEIEVFVYKDSNDRPIATVNTPLVTLHKVARLKVSQVTKIGAFLDWGLEKDLFLPFAQQTYRVKEGDEVLVSVYIDKSERVAAAMKIYPYLEHATDIKAEDVVEGTVYEISDNFGAFVAVDDKYSGLIPKRELTEKVSPTDVIKARISRIHEDGKLDLDLRKKAYMQMEEDAGRLLSLIEQNGGRLQIGDKSSEKIRQLTGMSKNEFKKACGRLYRERKILISEDETRIAP